jgi:integrase
VVEGGKGPRRKAVWPALDNVDDALDLARRELNHDLVDLSILRDEVERRRDRFGYTLLGGPFGPGGIERDSEKSTAKSHLALVAPATVIGTVPGRPPKRTRNADVRAREYLTNAEVDRLIKAAGVNRNGHRDATMVLVAYRHGLRPVELVTLRWDAIDFAHGQIHVSRAKNGLA